jgi:hypothetical protein
MSTHLYNGMPATPYFRETRNIGPYTYTISNIYFNNHFKYNYKYENMTCMLYQNDVYLSNNICNVKLHMHTQKLIVTGRCWTFSNVRMWYTEEGQRYHRLFVP